MYDLTIVGGGPAGVAAGVYAARKKMNSILVTDAFGGQSVVSADVQNWIGIKSVSGLDLAHQMEEHLRAQEGIEVRDADRVTTLTKIPEGFHVTTERGEQWDTRTVLLTTGSGRRKLGVPGEKEFEGRGVAYCSTCDAPLFGGKRVAVVGGGNSGLESVLDLVPYAAAVYLVHHSVALKGDPVTREKVRAHPKVTVLLQAETKEIVGAGGMVTGLRYTDKTTGEERTLLVDGVFVEIGSIPSSEVVKGLVNLNERGQVIVDHQTQQSSAPGIWAAGDVTDGLYKQNNISMGEAITATLNIYDFLRSSS